MLIVLKIVFAAAIVGLLFSLVTLYKLLFPKKFEL